MGRADDHAALARLRLLQHLIHAEDPRSWHPGDAKRLDDAQRRPHPGAHVDDRCPHAGRLLVRVTIHGHQTAVGLHQWVVPGQVAQWPTRSERGDGTVDDPWIYSACAREVEPEFVDRPRTEALDENIGAAAE